MREKLRLAILEAYGIDIDDYDFNYKTSLNSYTLNVNDFTIRVSSSDDVDKETRIERLKWARDLKDFKNTICEPVLSNQGNYVEEIVLGKWHMFLSMYRTAKGKLLDPNEIRPMTFIALGDMLGTMHQMSMERGESDKQYKIPSPEEFFSMNLKKVRPLLNQKLDEKITKIINQANTIDKNLENWGVCYGEYDFHNIIMDTNNVYLFDFDNSVYGHYIYDVASFAISLLASGYKPERKAKDIIDNIFLPWFRVGYGINKRCTEKTFDDLELFMNLRGVWVLVKLLEKYQKDPVPQVKEQIDFVQAILMGEDIFRGIDIARQAIFNRKKA